MKKVQIVHEPIVKTRVVRVAVNNNFNCTKKEWDQLEQIIFDNPKFEFFINSNIKTKQLRTINDHNIKAVVTMNPDINPWEKAIDKIYEINKNLITFLRVKYIPDRKDIIDLILQLSSEGYRVVITNQRFNGEKTLKKFTSKNHYDWNNNKFRLKASEVQKLFKIIDDPKNGKIFLCDRVNVGCSGCRLCSFIPTGQDLGIYSLNLSSSGICKFNCPDCYAKTMQNMLRRMDKPPIRFDFIKQNHKQAGRTNHIKENMEALNG